MTEWKAPATLEELLASGRFIGTNPTVAGAKEEKELERGEAPYQLYSLATPNGIKVGILLCELGVEFDEHVVKLNGTQFTSGFVALNSSNNTHGLLTS